LYKSGENGRIGSVGVGQGDQRDCVEKNAEGVVVVGEDVAFAAGVGVESFQWRRSRFSDRAAGE